MSDLCVWLKNSLSSLLHYLMVHGSDHHHHVSINNTLILFSCYLNRLEKTIKYHKTFDVGEVVREERYTYEYMQERSRILCVCPGYVETCLWDSEKGSSTGTRHVIIYDTLGHMQKQFPKFLFFC